MMELARQIGIDVPETKHLPVGEIKGLPAGIELVGDGAFAVKRFDRAPNGERIHIEDFAQVFGVYPDRKYERGSYRNIAQVLWIETGEVGIVEFVRRLVFSTLIGNADMHMKNWSLIYPNGRAAQLAPAYDLVSTIAYLPDDKLALTLVDSKKFDSVTIEQFERLAAKAGLPEKITLDTVTETVEAFRSVWRDFDIKALDSKTRRVIDKHLKTVPLWRETARKD
jgi:serine/threonine-protein kinase HipA